MTARTTTYYYAVDAFYPDGGWEEVTAEDNRDEARARLREYRENDTYALAHRIVRRRDTHEEDRPA